MVVHVINGEHPAAMQHGNSSSHSIYTANSYRITQQIVASYATNALLSHQMTRVAYNFKRYLLRVQQQLLLLLGTLMMGVHALLLQRARRRRRQHKHIER